MRSKINNAKQTDGYSCLKIKRREERDALLKKIGQCQRARDDRTRVPNTILIPASLVNEHLKSHWRLGRGRLIARQEVSRCGNKPEDARRRRAKIKRATIFIGK